MRSRTHRGVGFGKLSAYGSALELHAIVFELADERPEVVSREGVWKVIEHWFDRHAPPII
jgi:hypothetical protein